MGGGVGLVNFLIAPVYSDSSYSNPLYITQTRTPKLYNQLYSFLSNFDLYRIVYPIFYDTESAIRLNDRYEFTGDEYMPSDYRLIGLPEYIDMRDDDTTLKIFYQGIAVNYEIVYNKETNEIYTWKN